MAQQLSQRLETNRDAYVGIVSSLAEGTLPQIDNYLVLLQPVFQDSFRGESAFWGWLSEQVAFVSGGKMLLTVSDEFPGIGAGRLLTLSSQGLSRELFIGPDEIVWR